MSVPLRSWLSCLSRARRWLASARPQGSDVVLALAFSIVATWFALGAGPAHPLESGTPLLRFVRGGWSDTAPAAAMAVSLLITVPLAWRRRLPLAAVVAQFSGVALAPDQMNPAVFLAVLFGAYSLAASRCRPALSIGVLLTAATVTAVSMHTAGTTQGLLLPFVVLVPVGLAGIAIRAARTRAEDSQRRAEELRRGQEAATWAAVAQERARIARELHDVVSHHVSVMVIQAGAAGKVIDTMPELAREALHAIETQGREAMSELRNLLDLLAPSGEDVTPGEEEMLCPQPGLDQIGVLVERVRSAGQPVSLRWEVPSSRTRDADISRGVDIAAYRVVQEALTNVLRHAPGASTDVEVELRDGELVIRVTDDGVVDVVGRPSVPVCAGSGSGLVGLAERLRFYGGTLETGRRLGGGFQVCAKVPLELP